MKFALIPVKDLDGAKTRLGEALDAPARRALVFAMYRDVLAAATACSQLDGVFVVSESEEVLAIAEAAGAQGIRPDPSTSSGAGASTGSGLNADLSAAATVLAARGTTRLLVLFADLPCASADAIGRVIAAPQDVAIVAARDGGTNALALAPGAIEFQYGPDSAAKHIDAAERAGLSVAHLDEPLLALDIDTVEDLEALRSADGVGSHTAAALAAIIATSETGRAQD